MYDTTVKIGASKIQHGSANNRIYLMHVEKCDVPSILTTLDSMAKTFGYSKIFAKVPESSSAEFLNGGYIIEASVPLFFSKSESCLFMAKYMDHSRSVPKDERLNESVLECALSRIPIDAATGCQPSDSLQDGFSFRIARPFDSDKMANLYSKVFTSYPFPISVPEYIEQTMDRDVVYFGIWRGDDIVALSSCEMDISDSNVEMTDFAVLPEFRGLDFASFLLFKMEIEMKRRGITTAYTIARSMSYGMNIAFAKSSYSFAGRLVQNTQIGGGIEDMNVWYKHL